MSEMLETGLVVGPVTVVDNGDKSGVTVVMKGQKTVTHKTGTGYTTEDTVEISLTFKFRSMLTAEKLGIAQHEDAKVFVLRDRDESLQSFEEQMEQPLPAAMQHKLA